MKKLNYLTSDLNTVIQTKNKSKDLHTMIGDIECFVKGESYSILLDDLTPVIGLDVNWLLSKLTRLYLYAAKNKKLQYGGVFYSEGQLVEALNISHTKAKRIRKDLVELELFIVQRRGLPAKYYYTPVHNFVSKVRNLIGKKRTHNKLNPKHQDIFFKHSIDNKEKNINKELAKKESPKKYKYFKKEAPRKMIKAKSSDRDFEIIRKQLNSIFNVPEKSLNLVSGFINKKLKRIYGTKDQHLRYVDFLNDFKENIGLKKYNVLDNKYHGGWINIFKNYLLYGKEVFNDYFSWKNPPVKNSKVRDLIKNSRLFSQKITEFC